MARSYDKAQVQELLYQLLEAELGGLQIYETAISCAVNEDLRKEWQEYLGETKRHVEVATKLYTDLGLDPDTMTPGRQVVRHLGLSLVQAMEMAKASGDAGAAELVAREWVALSARRGQAG